MSLYRYADCRAAVYCDLPAGYNDRSICLWALLCRDGFYAKGRRIYFQAFFLRLWKELQKGYDHMADYAGYGLCIRSRCILLDEPAG